ncbi:MAG: hypothetical protein A2087_01180 [Spirochaetes bacterium GWD1_61_31]|nr:MAG: hypothetical protein A2087_01180 [Spirochaetes bacterium GWD1_61_31]OHD44165.1 MAG: hypothetical protein A2Y35_08810 [Spirochaetes bacterium GWE1_60_18]
MKKLLFVALLLALTSLAVVAQEANAADDLFAGIDAVALTDGEMVLVEGDGPLGDLLTDIGAAAGITGGFFVAVGEIIKQCEHPVAKLIGQTFVISGAILAVGGTGIAYVGSRINRSESQE